MKKENPENPAAFPRPGESERYLGGCLISGRQKGMSLREYFAGEALIGLIIQKSKWAPVHIVEESYVFADLMLKERQK